MPTTQSTPAAAAPTIVAASTEPKPLPKAVVGFNAEFADTEATNVPTGEILSINPEAAKPEDRAREWNCTFYDLAGGDPADWVLKFKLNGSRSLLMRDGAKGFVQFNKESAGWTSNDSANDQYQITVRGQVSEVTPNALRGLIIMHSVATPKMSEAEKGKYRFPAVGVAEAMLKGYSICSAKLVEKAEEK